MDERSGTLKLNLGEILGISGAYWKSLALHAGVRLDLFSVIGDARLSGAEIAGAVGGDKRGVTTLLDALAALGLLDKEDGRFANTPAARAAREIDLGGRRHLLDLDGGPGTWAGQFALANPGLRATVFDLPTTQPFAERVISAAGVADRVSFRGGDFTADEIPCCFDVAWLSHILHGEGPATCREVIGRAAKALEPGGMILVHEFILGDDRTSPQFAALFSLNMLSGTPEGRSYTVSELSSMLAEAGVREPRLLPFIGPTESRILAGTVAHR